MAPATPATGWGSSCKAIKRAFFIDPTKGIQFRRPQSSNYRLYTESDRCRLERIFIGARIKTRRRRIPHCQPRVRGGGATNHPRPGASGL